MYDMMWWDVIWFDVWYDGLSFILSFVLWQQRPQDTFAEEYGADLFWGHHLIAMHGGD